MLSCRPAPKPSVCRPNYPLKPSTIAVVIVIIIVMINNNINIFTIVTIDAIMMHYDSLVAPFHKNNKNGIINWV